MKIKYKLNGKEVSEEAFRAASEPLTLETMLAECQPPMANTDREFLEGHANGNQFAKTPELGDIYKKIAEDNGQDVKGKVYLPGLAAFPGDPQAWVSGKGDAKRVVEERGWGAEGSFSVPIQNVAEPTGGGVAPDIVENEVQAEIANNPEVACQPIEAVREQVTAKLKPHWAK